MAGTSGSGTFRVVNCYLCLSLNAHTHYFNFPYKQNVIHVNVSNIDILLL